MTFGRTVSLLDYSRIPSAPWLTSATAERELEMQAGDEAVVLLVFADADDVAIFEPEPRFAEVQP